jgi:hypothetical protein
MTSGAAPFYDLMRRLIASGGLRPRDPQVLAMEFMGPLMLWRHRHAITPNDRLVVNRQAFVREHVDQFLQGATAHSAGRARPVFRKSPVRSSRASTRRPRALSKVVS